MENQLILGPLVFEAFEIPEHISFGGRQRMTVHRLPGGQRVIDTLGADDADITWSGIFAGSDAAARAETVDLLRSLGNPLPLAWGNFNALVLIADFTAQLRHPLWIPYRIVCTVVQNALSAAIPASPDLLGDITGDLAAAARLGAATAQASTALAASNATTPGSPAWSSANAALASLVASTSGAIATSDATLSSAAYPACVDLAGTLARQVNAAAYLRRASRNLTNSAR